MLPRSRVAVDALSPGKKAALIKKPQLCFQCFPVLFVPSEMLFFKPFLLLLSSCTEPTVAICGGQWTDPTAVGKWSAPFLPNARSLYTGYNGYRANDSSTPTTSSDVRATKKEVVHPGIEVRVAMCVFFLRTRDILLLNALLLFL